MKQIKVKNSQTLIEEAQMFSDFREDCKDYLTRHGLNYDKFTVVSHDALIGCVSEKVIIDHLIRALDGVDVEIKRWEDTFNLNAIETIVENDDETQTNRVKEYFYDSYDISITNKNGDQILIDVKTALTAKTPNESWNFMYPVVQANKPGKDYMILAYYVVENTRDLGSLKNITLVGYTTEETIKRCKIIPKGTWTRFGTRSQTNNYETELSEHYRSIEEFVQLIKGFANCEDEL